MTAEKTRAGSFETLERAAAEGRPGAARELGHRLSVRPGAVMLEDPDETTDAERRLQQALELDSGDVLAAVLLGGLLHRQCGHAVAHAVWDWYDDDVEAEDWVPGLRRRWTEAEQWFRHALALDPHNGAAAAGLALMLGERVTGLQTFRDDFAGEDEDEIDLIELLDSGILFDDRGADGDGDGGDGDDGDGDGDGRGGDGALSEEALHWARRAMSANPGDAASAQLLATALGDRDPARTGRAWLRAVEFAPRDYRAAAQLVSSPLAGLDLGPAERLCREAAEGGDPEAVYSLALLLDATGRENEADAWLERPAARPVPLDLEPYGGYGPGHPPLPALRLAERFEGRGARRWAARAVLLAGHDMTYSAMNRYIGLLDGPDDGADVRAVLERRLDAGDGAAGFALFLLHEAQGRPEEAERCRTAPRS